MDTVRYDSGIAYEALQEVITQTIAYFICVKYKDDSSDVDTIISRLTLLKRSMELSNSSYEDALRYTTKVREQWNL